MKEAVASRTTWICGTLPSPATLPDTVSRSPFVMIVGAPTKWALPAITSAVIRPARRPVQLARLRCVIVLSPIGGQCSRADLLEAPPTVRTGRPLIQHARANRAPDVGDCNVVRREIGAAERPPGVAAGPHDSPRGPDDTHPNMGNRARRRDHGWRAASRNRICAPTSPTAIARRIPIIALQVSLRTHAP